jgi:hypothetical protein
MIKLNGLTIKNFMSVGNVSQAINFNSNDLVLVLGENLDLGGNDNRNGVGKAQPLHSKIKTPDGWTTMGDIKIGDTVSCPDGTSSIVTDIFPQGKIDTYRITFADGRTTECCENHLWEVFSHQWRKEGEQTTKVLTTKEIIPLLDRCKYNNGNNANIRYMYIPLIDDNSSDIELPIDPYILGTLLGDESFGYGGNTIGFTSADQEISDNISSRLPDGLYIKKSNIENYKYSILCGQQKNHPLRLKITELGLRDTLSHTKFIPGIYKLASKNQKLDLLAGLVDTDGHVGSSSSISISTSSKNMAEDIQEIVRSIGGIAKITSKIPYYTYKGERKTGLQNYNISIRYSDPRKLSKLSRKINKISANHQYSNLRLRIDKIEKLGLQDSKCILIDHPRHLYITDNYIVTHNSAIVNALSYALYGTALTNIKKDNLVNKSNMKNMLVTLTFEINGVNYKIERGRRPGIFKFIKDGIEKDSGDDESQGEGRNTQAEIERLIGISHDMFKHTLALNTYVEPFLSLRTNDQRIIIEQLLGITKLSEKADKLKEEVRITKDIIREEEFRISAASEANKRIEKNIVALNVKSEEWDKSKELKITKLQQAILELMNVNIDAEISLHKSKKDVEDLNTEYRSLSKELSTLEREVASSSISVSRLNKILATSVESICPTCNQDMDKETHTKVHDEYILQLKEANEKLIEKSLKRDDVKHLTSSVSSMIPKLPNTFYLTIDEAYSHKTTLDTLGNSLSSELETSNPYLEQIDALRKTGLQEIDFTKINDLTVLKDHQEYLLKLLTNKDSFIRKKIIDQNLTYLNQRLSYYLTDIGLPHSVKFKSDLEVEISMLGKEFDFDNLSRGERTRLVLSLSWAFRDVFENMNDKINLLFVDELLDQGLDASGVEAAVSILKKMGRENKRNIYLISHRDELVGRISNVLKVVKEGGFTSIETASS